MVYCNSLSHWPILLKHLPPVYTHVGQTFDSHSATIQRISQIKNELLRIPYSSIADSLYAFTNQERRVIDCLNGQSQMEHVLNIVILSLKNKQNEKFKDFLLALENNGWKDEAKKLHE